MSGNHLFVQWTKFSLAFYAFTLFFDFSLFIPDLGLLKWSLRAYWMIYTALTVALFYKPILSHCISEKMYLIVFGWLLLTAVVGINPSVGVFRWVLGIQLLLLIVCFTVAVPSPADLHRLMFYGFALIAGINAVIFVVNPSFSVDERGGFAGVLSDKNLAGQFNIVLLSLAGYFLLSTWKRRESLLAALVAVLALFFLIKTNSKTSIFLGLSTVVLCSVYYFVIARDRRITTILLLALGLFVGGGALWAGLTVTTTDQVAYAVRDVSLSGRVTIWHAVVTMIQDRPWIGHGFGSFWQTQDLLNGLGARTHLSEMEKWIDDARVINQAHNGYLDLLLSVGIIGLVLVVGAHFVALNKLRKLIRRPDVKSSDRYAFMAVHSSILTILLNNFLESTLFYSPFYSVGAMMLMFLVYANAWHAMERRTVVRMTPVPYADPPIVEASTTPVPAYAAVGRSRRR